MSDISTLYHTLPLILIAIFIFKRHGNRIYFGTICFYTNANLSITGKDILLIIICEKTIDLFKWMFGSL